MGHHRQAIPGLGASKCTSAGLVLLVAQVMPWCANPCTKRRTAASMQPFPPAVCQRLHHGRRTPGEHVSEQFRSDVPASSPCIARGRWSRPIQGSQRAKTETWWLDPWMVKWTPSNRLPAEKSHQAVFGASVLSASESGKTNQGVDAVMVAHQSARLRWEEGEPATNRPYKRTSNSGSRTNYP